MPGPDFSSARSEWIPSMSLEKLISNELSKQTLMIVDDYQSNLQAMEGLFEGQYEVVLMDNAKDAIKHAIDKSVDLILLDVDMPEMNGYEMCAELKSNAVTSHIPVIFVTAATSPDEEEKGLKLGALDYVVKPVNLSILRARVKNHMETIYYRKKLEVLSCVDGLTGVSNRRQLDTMLQQNIASTIRFGRSLAFLMIDIDNFKAYNDTYGHPAGDECLKKIAKAFMSVKRRETDVVGRYGGEEFTIIFSGKSPEQALPLLEAVRQAVQDYKVVIRQAQRKTKKSRTGKNSSNVKTVSVTISIGVAARVDKLNFEQTLKQADQALYRAKKSGRNNVSQ